MAEFAADNFARFILFRRWVREDLTLRPDGFVPYPYPDLSVTAHRNYNEQQIWDAGRSVAIARSLPLIGRADAPAQVYSSAGLKFENAPTADDPNHVNVVGWPDDKPAQKLAAQLIAKTATFIATPSASE